MVGKKTSTNDATGDDCLGKGPAGGQTNGVNTRQKTAGQSSCDNGYDQPIQRGPLNHIKFGNNQNSSVDRTIANPYATGSRPNSSSGTRPVVKNPYSKTSATSSTSSSKLPFNNGNAIPNNSNIGGSQQVGVTTANHNSTINRTQQSNFAVNPYNSSRKPPREQESPSSAACASNDGSRISSSSNLQNASASITMQNSTIEKTQENSFVLNSFSPSKPREYPVRQPESAAGIPCNEAPDSFCSSAQNMNRAYQQFDRYHESSVHRNGNQMMQTVGTIDHTNKTSLSAVQPPSNHCFSPHSEKGALNSTPENRVQTSSMHSLYQRNQINSYNSFSKHNQETMEKQKPSHNASSIPGSIGLFRENKNSSGTKIPWSKE